MSAVLLLLCETHRDVCLFRSRVAVGALSEVCQNFGVRNAREALAGAQRLADGADVDAGESSARAGEDPSGVSETRAGEG